VVLAFFAAAEVRPCTQCKQASRARWAVSGPAEDFCFAFVGVKKDFYSLIAKNLQIRQGAPLECRGLFGTALALEKDGKGSKKANRLTLTMGEVVSSGPVAFLEPAKKLPSLRMEYVVVWTTASDAWPVPSRLRAECLARRDCDNEKGFGLEHHFLPRFGPRGHAPDGSCTP
jgi:hypothetical protein